MTAVIDASVLLAAILNEPGGQAVHLAGQRCTSAVNAAETRSRLIDLGMSSDQAELSIELLGTPIESFTADQAKSAAELRAATRKAGLSLGDRACIALAMAIGGRALTADRAWSTLDLPVEIEVIR